MQVGGPMHIKINRSMSYKNSRQNHQAYMVGIRKEKRVESIKKGEEKTAADREKAHLEVKAKINTIQSETEMTNVIVEDGKKFEHVL